MAVSDGLTRVEIGDRHIDDAMELVREAGWNQTAADWRMMASAGKCIGLEDEAGHLVASAAALPYGGEFGWISMVLVTARWRRKGVATVLLKSCIAEHESAGRTPVLDATPDGEQVYRRLGFEGALSLQRWQREASSAASIGTDPDAPAVRPVVADDLGKILQSDRDNFGGERPDIIRDIFTRDGAQGWMLAGDSGFLLSRRGSRARQLGPSMAQGEEQAVALLRAAVAQSPGAVFLDVPDGHEGVVEFLKTAGFTSQRPFLRMLKGRSSAYGDVDSMCVIAGPELG